MIEIENLSFAYRNYKSEDSYTPLFTSLSLHLQKGSKALILGKPDSGKTTLSRVVSALIPRHIEGKLEGKCLLMGKKIQETTPWELTESLTLITQNPQDQLLMTTCGDEVAFPLESLGYEHNHIVKRVDSALKVWGLSHLKEVNPQEISGGEQKRLLLAVAEAIDAPIWVMDEPFDNLDESWKEVLFHRLSTSNKSVLLFASRYYTLYDSLFDSFYRLSQQELVTGEKEEIVKEFEKECNSFTPKNSSVKRSMEGSTLSVANAKLIHPRRSFQTEDPFTLSIKELTLLSNEVVALVGPNGAGKSTLSQHLCGLQTLVEGSISIDGKKLEPKELQHQVGYLFQNPDWGIFLPTVGDELSWSIRHLEKKEQQKIVTESAALFHLNLDDNPTMMSYGARKALQAALFYSLKRRFIIIDEIDSGVTYPFAHKIVSLFVEKGCSVLLITHDREFAKGLAERQYTIIDKEVVETEVGV